MEKLSDEEVKTIFKSLSTFINGICQKKRNDVPERCIEMITKIILSVRIKIMKTNKDIWYQFLNIIENVQKNNNINQVIKESMKNVLVVMVFEELLIKDSEDWNKSWEILQNVVDKNEFMQLLNINDKPNKE